MYLKLLKQILSLVILCCSTVWHSGHAQQLSSEQIKAAYLYNFIKHVQWPDEKDKSGFTIAIYQNPEFYAVISQALAQRLVKNKPIKILSLTDIKAASQADVVFTSKKGTQEIAQLALALRRTGTLLVTDNSIDKHNVMINLVFNPSSSAITFEVNKSNILYENLTISKELLLLGGSEIDVATLYRETELAMQKMRQREYQLNQELTAQQQQIDTTSNTLEELNLALHNKAEIAEKHQQALDILKSNIAAQKHSCQKLIKN